MRGILQEDFAFWILASVGLAPHAVTHVLGLLALLVSFWAIYEQGYVDNDRIAKAYEAAPRLTPEFHASTLATPWWLPWTWAVIAGAIGAVLVRTPALPGPFDLCLWITILLATSLWFRIYNRLDKGTRVWLFAGLQFARSTAFAALVPISLVGALGLGAHVVARWVPYYVYRVGGKEWPDAPFHLIRLLFFVIICAVLALAGAGALLLGPTALMMLAWILYRARGELAEVLQAAGRIDLGPRGRLP